MYLHDHSNNVNDLRIESITVILLILVVMVVKCFIQMNLRI